VIDTKIRYAGIHGYHHKSLGTSLIQAGESKEITVLAVLPIFYDSVYTTAAHPAYYINSSSSDKMPFALRTVQLAMLQPRSWAKLLETGEALREGGVGITAGNVNDHFYTILRYFLPAFDQAGGQEDLRLYLPLLEKLAAFAQTEQALENSQLSMRNVTPREYADKYVESVKRTEERYRMQVKQNLAAIKGWFALKQSERLPMYTWLKNLHKADYVFDQVMDDSDRKQVYKLLEQREKPGSPRSAEWTNPTSRIKFTLSLETKTGGKTGSGYRTRLHTDLNPRLDLVQDEAYSKNCYPEFSNDAQKSWHLLRSQ